MFAAAYAANLEPAQAQVLAAAQRPFDPTALSQTFDQLATWRTLPSWAVIATSDRAIPTEAQRWMAERAGSTVVEVDASHAVPLAQPDVVAAAITASTTSIDVDKEILMTNLEVQSACG
jgi:pimeloyl-ACP methyl ester carboxylesterase